MDNELKREIMELMEELRQQDSIEIGNSKTGVLKIYFNAAKPAEARQKIVAAKELFFFAREGILNGEKS